MNTLTLNLQELTKWVASNGDNTHNISYDLNKDSIIMDLGGYTGVWAQQMINKYNPNVYILEPIPEFYAGMVSKFSDNPKVKLLNIGVGVEDTDGFIYISGDGTSSNLLTGEKINIKFNTIETILRILKLEYVDLLQINIEGDEYPLLENMLLTGSINKFKTIQIQFHLGIKNDIERRNNIRQKLLLNGFRINFDYPFVWESWSKI